MSINVLFFARYSETIGLDSLEMEGDFATVDAVRQALVGDAGFDVLNETSLMCARNQEMCQRRTSRSKPVMKSPSSHP